jgi:hypothetical protein
MIHVLWRKLVPQASGYAIGILFSKYLAGSLAVFLAKCFHEALALYGSDVNKDIVVFYTSNWLVFNVLAGLLCGFFMYPAWTSTVTVFVWVPSAVVLGNEMLANRSVLSPSAMSGLHHFLSAGCGNVSFEPLYISPQCSDQVQYSLPFYAAIGFSAGVLTRQLSSNRLKSVIARINLAFSAKVSGWRRLR